MAEQDKRQALLAAARTVFARDGFHRAAVRDIAQEAGVATGTFYLYFSSKEACLLGLIDDFYRLLMTRILESRAVRAGVLDKLAASIATVVRTFAAHRDLARIVLAAGAHPAFDERLAALHGDFARMVGEDLAEAIAEGLLPEQDVAVTAPALVGAIYEVIVARLREGRPEDLEAAVPALAGFCLRGAGGGFDAAPSNRSAWPSKT